MADSKLEFAQKALQILHEEAGLVFHDDEHGPDPIRRQFENSIARDPNSVEFRFIGGLGFGGKIYVHGRHFRFPRSPGRRPGEMTDYRCYVDTYPEDMTPERREMIDRTNARLSALADEYVEVFTGEFA